MAEINNIEIIQNKIDALVEKIIQKENSDENFRITYAQILEKINTKMDVFSSGENLEKLGMIALEIRNLIQDRQNIVDGKFNAIKGEFDNINEILLNSLKTPEFLAAFNKIQNQIHFFSEEQENQKEAFNSIISHIEKFGTLEETNDMVKSNFAIVKEQNTIINENVNKQINLITELNSSLEEKNKKTIEELNELTLSLKEFIDTAQADTADTKVLLAEKVDSVIEKIHETDSYIDVLNNNVTTIVQVLGNIFDDEEFQNLHDDVTDVLAKTTFISDTLKNIATKEELLENSSKNKEEIKKHNQELLLELEHKIFDRLDFSDIQDIKNYTEKMFFQGTEVLKEEMWAVKDTVADVKKNTLSAEKFDEKINELKSQITEDLTDTISTESVATAEQINQINTNLDNLKRNISDTIYTESLSQSNQINEISSTIEDLRKDLSEIILNEQAEQINIALNALQTKFVTQLVQIADNISFEEEADEINENLLHCSEDIKEKISSNISDIKEEISQLKEVSGGADTEILSLLEQIDEAVKTDINQDLKTLISGFKLLTSGLKEDKDYVYTLPDVESDLSKIRLDLTNLHKLLANTEADNSEAGDDISTKLNLIKSKLEKMENSPLSAEIAEVKSLFTGLNEDVSSISKRTNKLILSSDELSKTLKANIDNFSSLIKTFEKQSKEFYNSAFVNNLDKKIDNLNRTTTSLMQSDKVLNEAFMYLAEWIDTASTSFEEIKSEIDEIKGTLVTDENNLTERIESADVRLKKLVEQQNETKKTEDENMQMIMSTVFPILILPFFALTIFLVQMVGAEINDEKTTRGMEIIISNVSPQTHLFSKVIASNLFVLFQAALLVIYAIIGFVIRNLISPATTNGFDINSCWC